MSSDFVLVDEIASKLENLLDLVFQLVLSFWLRRFWQLLMRSMLLLDVDLSLWLLLLSTLLAV